jgi:hypothetical protein
MSSAITAMTTSSSMSVNPRTPRRERNATIEETTSVSIVASEQKKLGQVRRRWPERNRSGRFRCRTNQVYHTPAGSTGTYFHVPCPPTASSHPRTRSPAYLFLLGLADQRMARFHVNTTFEIASRGYSVLCGDVVEGVIRAGMIVRIPMNSGVFMPLPIHSIEIVTASGKGKNSLGLCVRADENERALLKGLHIRNETFDVVER